MGWKGLVDGKDSGIYTVAPLGRLNAASGMATPKAQEAYEKYFATLSPDGTPVHSRGATHWARLIELMQAAETVQALVNDPEITSPDVRAVPDRDARPRVSASWRHRAARSPTTTGPTTTA